MLRNYIIMHLVILSWGFTGIIGKLVTLTAVDLVWWRTLIAAVCLFGWLYFTGRLQPTSVKNKLRFIGLGILVGIHWITFFHSIKISNISLTLTILAACPMFISLVEPILFRRRISLMEIILSVLSFIILGYILGGQAEYSTAIWVALFSTFVVSIFCIYNARLAKHHPAGLMSAYEMLGAFIFCTLYYIFTGSERTLTIDFFAIGLSNLSWILVLAIACTAVAFLLSIYLYKFISAFTFSLSNNLETVYGILLGYIIFGESELMSTDFYVAAMLLLIIAISDPLIRSTLKAKHL